VAGDERRLGLCKRPLAEVRAKPPARGASRCNCCSGGLQSEPLLARQIALLRALLAVEQAVLRLEYPLLLALRACAFRLLRL
jgi:hypothetical protein